MKEASSSVRKLYSKIDRFCALHPNFGIPNLMRYIVAGNVVVYLLFLLTGRNFAPISFLAFNLESLLHGEIWRLISFIFVPNSFGAIALILSLYLYYFIGNTLEQRWGTAKFTIYYVGGVVLTLIGTVAASLITGIHSLTIAGTSYINLSLFLAFATLFPDVQLLLIFIPIKIKWLAYLDAAIFLIDIVSAIGQGDIIGVVLPVVALLNYVVFFLPTFLGWQDRQRYICSRQNTRFRRTVRQQQAQEKYAAYHHKCAVCGRTDADHPDLQFRYCSRCAGYHCFCQDHIFNHVHFTEE